MDGNYWTGPGLLGGKMTACRQNIEDFDRSEISVIVRILHGGKYAIRKLQFAHSTQARQALVSTGAVEELTVRYVL